MSTIANSIFTPETAACSRLDLVDFFEGVAQLAELDLRLAAGHGHDLLSCLAQAGQVGGVDEARGPGDLDEARGVDDGPVAGNQRMVALLCYQDRMREFGGRLEARYQEIARLGPAERSALDAYVRHFDVVIATDAVAAIYDDLGDAALTMMERNMGADLTRAEEVEFG